MDYSGQTSLGCGVLDHDDACLCDVHVPAPVAINPDAIRFMWNIDRVAAKLRWSKGDNPLDLLTAILRTYDHVADKLAADAAYIAPIKTEEIEQARARSMSAVDLSDLEAERQKVAAAFVACDGSTLAALNHLGWDWDTLLMRAHLYANAFRSWPGPEVCDRYIAARLSGATRSTLRVEFGMLDGNISSIDTCVGMGQLIAMRGLDDQHAISSHNTQLRHPSELREFCVQGRRNGMAVADLIRICHERFGQAPSRPTIYKWEKADVDSRNPLAVRNFDQDAA